MTDLGLIFCPSPKADGQIYYHWYISSVLKLCPWPSAGPQIKKLNTDNTEEHGLVFHG